MARGLAGGQHRSGDPNRAPPAGRALPPASPERPAGVGLPSRVSPPRSPSRSRRWSTETSGGPSKLAIAWGRPSATSAGWGPAGGAQGEPEALRGALTAVGLGLKKAAAQELGMISCVSRSSFPSSSRPLRFCESPFLSFIFFFSFPSHAYSAPAQACIHRLTPAPRHIHRHVIEMTLAELGRAGTIGWTTWAHTRPSPDSGGLGPAESALGGSSLEVSGASGPVRQHRN